MTDLRVVPLAAPTPETEGLVAALEAILKQAKAGDIESFSFCATRRDRSVIRAHGFTDQASIFALIGTLAHEQRYVSQKIDRMNAVTDFIDGDDT